MVVQPVRLSGGFMRFLDVADNLSVDVGAIKAVTDTAATSYRSFADATRSVLDLLERLLPGATVYLAHLDRTHDVHRIVDVRGSGRFPLTSNQASVLSQSFCRHMADGEAPRVCNDVAGHRVYSGLAMQRTLGAGSYVGVPLELSDGARVASLAALAPAAGRFSADDEQVLLMLARVLAAELERETNQRDLRRLNDSLRDQARGMGAVGRVARVLAGGEDARKAVCRAACELTGAPISFLLEPSGREFCSTAMAGIELAPITIQPRAETSGRAFTARESYFVADARSHPALAAPLVDATAARSALFEPVLRDGQVAGVLIIVWKTPLDALPDATAGLLRVLTAQAAVAIEHAGLHARVESLALSDALTGLASRRVWDEELTREMARARRGEFPLSIAVLELDTLDAFSLAKGEREGERLLKEAAALWRGQLRDVDLLARLDETSFGIVLPNCALEEAVDVVDRVRAASPRGQTASAGAARWDGEEPAELLHHRCEDALVSAKLAGGDLTVPTD
jgi:diguanylate cyclase (GGDEF)-like protein